MDSADFLESASVTRAGLMRTAQEVSVVHCSLQIMVVVMPMLLYYAEICQPPCGENGVCNVNTGYCDCSAGFTGPSCDDGIKENRTCVVHYHTIYSQI